MKEREGTFCILIVTVITQVTTFTCQNSHIQSNTMVHDEQSQVLLNTQDLKTSLDCNSVVGAT